MVSKEKIIMFDKEFYAITVKLPKTTLLVVGNDVGFFMCGALDVSIYDSTESLRSRGVVCGRAQGVKTIDDLINGKLTDVSSACSKYHIKEGMLVKDALMLIS